MLSALKNAFKETKEKVKKVKGRSTERRGEWKLGSATSSPGSPLLSTPQPGERKGTGRRETLETRHEFFKLPSHLFRCASQQLNCD